MHPMLNIAVRAARAAGKVIARSFEHRDHLEITEKSANDYVTNVDREAERVIIEVLHKSYPDHSFVGEEGGEQAGTNSDYQWVIDPIDGTTNFLRGIPHFAVSIALLHKGKLDQAVVYDPIRDELFTASRGNGAQLNDRRLRTSARKDLDGALLATAFPFRKKAQTGPFIDVFKALFEPAGDVRRAGAASLDLAYVAAGRLDGYFELGLKPWDLAAGELLVREAGGMVTDWVGNHNHWSNGNIVATATPRLTQAMLTTMRPHLSASMQR